MLYEQLIANSYFPEPIIVEDERDNLGISFCPRPYGSAELKLYKI